MLGLLCLKPRALYMLSTCATREAPQTFLMLYLLSPTPKYQLLIHPPPSLLCQLYARGYWTYLPPDVLLLNPFLLTRIISSMKKWPCHSMILTEFYSLHLWTEASLINKTYKASPEWLSLFQPHCSLTHSIILSIDLKRPSWASSIFLLLSD